MSQSFEQYFAQQPEEEKSPEKIKEEKALALAEEIKRIKEKKEKTIEDYQKIIELAHKIEELYEEKERDYEAEFKTIVANLKKALEEGADKNYVAWGLAGVNTE